MEEINLSVYTTPIHICLYVYGFQSANKSSEAQTRGPTAYRLKVATARLARENGLDIILSADSKSDRGFNHDILGRLLVPIQHIAEYDKDPIG
jgi:hypothetical protein